MRILIQILLFLIISIEIFACGDSYQYRLFPIGMDGQSAIAIETSLNRYWGPDTVGTTAETRNRWRGTISLIRLVKGMKPELIEIIDTLDILDRDYVKELKPYFTIAVQKVEQMKNLILAENTDIEFCNFKLECKTVSLKKDSLENLTVVGENRIENIIEFPIVVIDNSESSGGMFNQDFKMNSIRKIKIGESELLIINFASGEDHNTDFVKQIEEQKKHEYLEGGIYKELTLYHGLAFDSIIWN